MTTKQITLISSQSSKLGGYDLETTPYQKLKKDLEQFLIYQLSINESITIHTGAAAGIEQLWGLAAVVIKKSIHQELKSSFTSTTLTKLMIYTKTMKKLIGI